MSKSILIYLLFTVISTGLMAQSIDDIKDFAGKNQWDKAKEAVDKHLLNEKNSKKGDGWYWKAVIYNAVARQNNLHGQPVNNGLIGKSKAEIIDLFGNPTSSVKSTRNDGSTELLEFADKKLYVYLDQSGKVVDITEITGVDPRMESFNAYKKYLEMDPKMTMGILSQHAALFDVCFGYLEEASKAFNNKEYEQSLNQFKNAEKVEEFIVSKGFTYGEFGFPSFDTQLYLNIAASATQAKKEDVALEYYMKIADKKIVDTGFAEIYRYIVDRLIRKKDKPNIDKYTAIGKGLYPNDPFWCESALIAAGEDQKKMFAIYETLIKGPCGSYQMLYNYAIDLFNYCYAADSTPKDYNNAREKLTEILTKAIALKSSTEANMLMSRHIFAYINDLYDEITAIKGTKPEDVKKKADLNTQMTKKYEEAIPFATAAYNNLNSQKELKPVEKGNLKLLINMLIECWERKNDKVKAEEYKKKMKEVE